MAFQLDTAHKKRNNYAYYPPTSCPAPAVLGVLQINRLVRKNLAAP